MCDFSKGFILCRCNDPGVVVHNKGNRRNKKGKSDSVEYKWTLFRYIGISKEQEIGGYFLPVSDIGKGLTSRFVLAKLNNENPFDFEYKPTEGDNLIISNPRQRLEFIFRLGKWEEDHYSPFDDIYEEFDRGKLIEIKDVTLPNKA
jgi:hypothetical protein